MKKGFLTEPDLSAHYNAAPCAVSTAALGAPGLQIKATAGTESQKCALNPQIGETKKRLAPLFRSVDAAGRKARLYLTYSIMTLSQFSTYLDSSRI